MKKNLVCLMFAVFCCCSAFNIGLAQSFDESMDKAILSAKSGSIDAKINLFSVATSDNQRYVRSLAEKVKPYQNDVYFQSVMAECLLTLNDVEQAFEIIKKLNLNDQFSGEDKYMLASMLLVKGRESKEERYFEEASTMFKSLKKSGFNKYDNIDYCIAICDKDNAMRTMYVR